MAQVYNGNGRLQWPARVREVIENIEPVNAPSCYRTLLSGSLELTARLKSVDDLDLLRAGIEQSIFREERSLGGRSIDLDLKFRSGSVSPRAFIMASASAGALF